MPNTQQSFLAAATEEAAADLVAVFVKLPEDRRLWQPAESARPAIDQMAECALLNGYIANLLQTRQWLDGQIDRFLAQKAELVAQGWEEIHPRLVESAGRVAAAIAAIPDADLTDEIESLWGKRVIARMITFPHWNMNYHEGQIKYIASLLGPLD